MQIKVDICQNYSPFHNTLNHNILKNWRINLGTLAPGKIPIFNTVANKGEVADYTFSMIPQDTVPPNGN